MSNTNSISKVIELATGKQFADKSAQRVFYTDSKDDATLENVKICRPLEQISKGSIIFTSVLDIGIFKEDKSIEWQS